MNANPTQAALDAALKFKSTVETADAAWDKAHNDAMAELKSNEIVDSQLRAGLTVEQIIEVQKHRLGK